MSETCKPMSISSHAFERIEGRLNDVESAAVIRASKMAWFKASKQGVSTVAVIALQLPSRRTCTDGSTGDLVCGVVRNGELKTVFLRGSGQDLSVRHFRTEKVVRAVKVRTPRRSPNRRRW